MIKKIEIENIKGIGADTPNKCFEFDLYPNKPNIFVAPNGFGKSSLAIAFKSLNQNRINLDSDHHYEENEDNVPSIEISYIDNDGVLQLKTATNNSNEIKDTFGWFVINSQVFAKARQYGGNFTASASLETPTIVLQSTIPQNIKIGYSVNNQRHSFGNNGKVLPNISDIYDNKKFMKSLSQVFTTLGRISNQGVQNRINAFKDRVNAQQGTRNELLEWIDDNELESLDSIPNLTIISQLIASFDLGFENESEIHLSAIQIASDYNENRSQFKSAVKRKIYELKKEKCIKLFNDFNSSWKSFVPKEKNGKLIAEIPKTIHISNGQRDIMCFVALLIQAEIKLTKENSILIIDEIFDYLDDANLIAAQYYITKLIKKFKTNDGKKIYPIILTHLNPHFFKNFTFSNQKVFFLQQKEAKTNEHLKKILIKREDPSIKENLAKYHLHFDPTGINIRTEFENLGLKPTWGVSSNFETYIDEQFSLYLAEETVYDPHAVCCAIRKKVEELAYNQLDDAIFKDEFLTTHTTPKKLNYAEEKGAIIPETHYLLGIIYNDGLHWKNNESAIAGKLENLTIRKMISEIQ
ncbi:hypothetical protein GF1_30010 [Desulfolithobacter dissulfuricans]|uniref:Uncharacterized protein n=1 Tax=Desulfolithobacter dissulfuricans TaxID=2795293 RepID=A0A915UBE7_9BACT|nr:hypothetical protein [Desulfolithobacter dissulfuricans]BCO10625.1 hypothetical protein GF1_30010 [Desulfolithobacter dissulfuricans]